MYQVIITFYYRFVRNVDAFLAGQKGYIDNFIELICHILETKRYIVQPEELQKLDKEFDTDMRLSQYMSTANNYARVLRI